MALTLKVELRLEGAGLTGYFDKNREEFAAAASAAHNFIAGRFPERAKIRRDDIKQPLLSALEVHPGLRKALAKLTQKYWFSDFTDLVIDRTWKEIHGADDEKEQKPE